MDLKLERIEKILTRSAKTKGKKLQNWVRDQILALFPSLDKEDVKSTIMGENGLDIQLTKIGRNTIPIGVECKNHATFAIYKHYEQAVTNTYKTSNLLEPVLFIKGNHKKPLAVVDAEYFLTLMRAKYDISLVNINDPDKDAT